MVFFYQNCSDLLCEKIVLVIENFKSFSQSPEQFFHTVGLKNFGKKIPFLNLGKVVWLSGPPGAGKSTTAQLMGRDAGYVYYEADCALNFLNPFVPTDVDNPTLAAFRQKPLKVLGSQRSQTSFLIRLFRSLKKLLCFSGCT